MKLFNNIIYPAVALTLVAATSCNDLDTEPQGQYITSEEKAEANAVNPSLGLAGVVAISTDFALYNRTFTGEQHADYGYPSTMLFLDQMGTDMVGLSVGYNWYTASCALGQSPNGNCTAITWYTLYRQIDACNSTLTSFPEGVEDAKGKYFRAQALAMRANAYFVMAQMYQRTYKGHESEPCIPIITTENSSTAALDGCPRSTVQEVYDRIDADINEAITLIAESGMTPTSVLETGSKRFLSLGAAYGIRARINLVKQNWADAASDARMAINNSGATPYSLEEVSHPFMAKMTDHAWMWGIYMDEQNRLVTSGIVNWPSHMGSLNYGYASVGAWRMIAQNLYDNIPATDIRKGWFLDGEGQSANLSDAQQSYMDGAGCPAYTQVKFAPYQDVIYQSTNANDICLMRIEEMYLIEAEATAMSGNVEGGKQLLVDWVTTYRDPSYSTRAATAEAVQDAVWQQRRIELWGEGISYFDLVRLNKGIDRRGGGWETQYVFNEPAGTQQLVFCIPQSETNRNPLISPEDNNPSVGAPTPVADNE
ncbi:MAG: RagB/SusD family nutrient uptake outer membrane protein [Pseudoflavonifractor sp.]|nr:RagB/SusD family nutrient uptake outer membrane protein [Alloprevotella sp.]MCM1116977.1 RagB/SusD family nutrient uptake outer membrane protein [Pseudoflavonifractor sp.]